MRTGLAAGHSLTIEELDTAADLTGPIAAMRELDRERVPEDAPMSDADYTRRLRLAMPPDARVYRWIARDASGEVLGYARLDLEEADNEHLGFCSVGVVPRRRRTGVGSRLLGEVSARTGAEGRTTLVGTTVDRVPSGAAFAAALGAKRGLDLKTSQLDLRAVDRSWLEATRATAEQKARGYTLVRVPQPTPEELLEPLCAAFSVMNDAPRGEIAFTDEIWTPQRIRDRDEFFQRAERTRWTLLAMHAATGETVGYTEVVEMPETPAVLQQYGTAVAPAHRGHRIGMWLKSTALGQVLADRPGALFVRTGNATTNDAMLRINEELGFRYAWTMSFWQSDVAALRTRLAPPSGRS
ncbi:MAG: GNAT family N-acetyltransferase [Candidatus Limnocylindria bacterium]